MDPTLNTWCQIINQLHVLELRTHQLEEHDFYLRRFERIRDLLGALDLRIHNPLGETYDHTRTDCEAIIQGELNPPLIIVEVIKPVIYHMAPGGHRIVQPGVVIIQGQTS